MPRLAHPALSAFQGLLWTGLALLAVGLVAGVVGLSSIDSGDVIRQASAFAFAGFVFPLAAPFLAGAWVVVGLGKREGSA